jgi:uncharacterized protein YigE (DUF2233 family)
MRQLSNPPENLYDHADFEGDVHHGDGEIELYLDGTGSSTRRTPTNGS